MKNQLQALIAAVSVAAVLAACGGGGNDTVTPASNDTLPPASTVIRGQLIQSPPTTVVSLSAPFLAGLLQSNGAAGQGLLQLAGTPVCGVEVRYMQFRTVGGKGEPATASGALMVPTGTSPACNGPRPIVLYAHGTASDKSYNIANLVAPANPAYSEAAEIAALFAAQGYIVVATNYVGYDSSDAAYHPYLVADQQSRDMIDALTAARTALPLLTGTTATDNGKLFITGYSQGGFVAMATHRAMQAAGMTVTASSPGSGFYPMAAFQDFVFSGHPSGPFLEAFIIMGYQNSYGNIYSASSDIYTGGYVNVGSALLTNLNYNLLVQQGMAPASAVFSATPPAPAFAAVTPAVTGTSVDALFASGFGDPSLITNAYRLAYLQDMQAHPDGLDPATLLGMPTTTAVNTLRRAAALNDLRGFAPRAPVLLCGGTDDPTVLFANHTAVMKAQWSAAPPPASTLVLDVASPPLATNDGFNALRAGYQAGQAATYNAAYSAAIAGGQSVAAATRTAQAAVLSGAHLAIAPFCGAAARSFFSSFL